MKYGQRFTYDCEHKTKLPGKLVAEDQTIRFNDDIVRLAHENARIVRQFYKEVLNRNSIDDKGMNIECSVHYDVDYNNAFWTGTQYVCGDSDKKLFTGFVQDLSVIAHEMSHGVVQFTCGLKYWSQSGASNESYADRFGIACEHWSKKESDPKTAGWFLGDDIIGPAFPNGKGLRSFTDEPAYQGEKNPRHMKNYSWSLKDNQQVHGNSSIMNKAFYNMCINLNEPSYGMPIQICYKALGKLKSNSNFKTVAKAEVESAKELYGDLAASLVKKAYADVGINL